MLDQAIFNHPVRESSGACAKLLHDGVCIHGGKRREKLRHLSRDLVALAFCNFGLDNRSAHGTNLQQRNDRTGNILVWPPVSSSGHWQARGMIASRFKKDHQNQLLGRCKILCRSDPLSGSTITSVVRSEVVVLCAVYAGAASCQAASCLISYGAVSY